MNFSDYIVYVDESGDHGVANIDSYYPIFVLTFCVFKKHHYCNVVLPAMCAFKMKYWGHNNIILHEMDIRHKKKTEYIFLNQPKIYKEFMNDIAHIMTKLEFFHITTIIDKTEIKDTLHENNIYELALLFCMEQLHVQLMPSQRHKKVEIIVESRGKKEDNELELEFRRILIGQQKTLATKTDFQDIEYNFNIHEKKENITGLQISDLIARPIGLHHLKPHQPNKAYDIINAKNNRYTLTKDNKTIIIYPKKQKGFEIPQNLDVDHDPAILE